MIMKKKELFERVMRSADDSLLEEAQSVKKRSSVRFRVVSYTVAACLCIAAAGAIWQPWNRAPETAPTDGSGAQIANPVQPVTADDLERLGYSLPLPENAQDVSYSTISADGSAALAQVTFLSGGAQYTCRALKTETSEDISGIYANWSESLDWKAGALDMQLREADDTAWVGWYSADAQTQWCLSGPDGDSLSLLSTAQQIVESLGYEMAVAPDGATDVTYNACALDGLTVAETGFTFGGVRYAYRTASTSEVDSDFADISGITDDGDVSASAEVSWCPARLYYTESGAGRIVWFDVVPGLLYSLSMDSGASEAALTGMAASLFVPAQGDVG